jgi:hypothetical protein
MGVSVNVDCLDCLKRAPSMGRGGLLGRPVLEVAPETEGAEWPWPTFGFFYEPLAALGVQPYCLEAYRDFLGEHCGHRIHISTGDEDLPEISEINEAECGAGLAGLHAEEARMAARIASGEFTEGFYELRCTECQVAHTATDSEVLRTFPPSPVSRVTVGMFMDRWATRDAGEGWSSGLRGIADPLGPFLRDLPDFLEAHRDHPLERWLSPGEGRSRPTRADEAWPAPELRSWSRSLARQPGLDRMGLGLGDITAQIPDLDSGDALEAWRRLDFGDARPFVVTALGDVFVEWSNGEIGFLDTYEGVVRRAAPDAQAWTTAVQQSENLEAWFSPSLVLELRRRGLVLSEGQCYSPLQPLVLGGTKAAENFAVTSWRVHVGMIGRLYQQVRHS